MVIDCDGCAARGPACGGCVISTIVDRPPGPVHIDAAEWRVMRLLIEAGMLPPLRLVALARPAPVVPARPAEVGAALPIRTGRPVRRAA